MKAAFEKGDFVRLQELLDSSDQSNFYRGIMAEHGLAGDVNLTHAEFFYKDAYKDGKGSLEAGLALAEFYLKNNRINEARKIYSFIATKEWSTKNEKISKKYAQYELLKLQEKALIEAQENNQENIDRADDIFREYESFLKSINPNSVLYAEVLYHKAQMALWISKNQYESLERKLEEAIQEELEEFKKTYKPKVTGANISGARKTKEIELREGAQTKLEEESRINQARELLKEASAKFRELGYVDNNPAQASLSTFEAYMLFRDKKYDLAISTCELAIRQDKNSIEARLLKSSILETKIQERGNLNFDLLDQSLKLVREVLVIDPSNSVALRRLEEQKNKMVRLLTAGIVEKLKEKSSSLDEGVWFKSKFIGQRERYIDSLSPIIANALSNSAYIKEKLTFENMVNDAEVIGNRIWLDTSENIGSSLNNDQKDRNLQERIELKIENQVGIWDARQRNVEYVNLSDNEIRLITKRKAFKQKIIENLETYYIRCRALTDEGTDLEVRLGRDWLALATDALPVVMAAALPGYGVVAGAAVIGAKKLSEAGQKAALYRAAEKFCKIGDRNMGKAAKSFDYIADKIVEQYGAQIDNIMEVSQVADVATEKMLDHVRNASITREMWERFANPQESALNMIRAVAGVRTTDDKSPEQLLLDGLVSGNPKSREPLVINTEDGREGEDKWIAHEVFENPVLTKDGEYFYCSREKIETSNKYGAKFVGEIPKVCVLKRVSSRDIKYMHDALTKHQKLLNSPAWLSSEKKEANKKIEARQNIEDVSKEEAQQRTKRLVGVVKLVLGATVLGCAKIIGAAVAVGTLTSGAAIPIAIAAGVVGLASFMYGIKDATNSSMRLQEIEITKRLHILEGQTSGSSRAQEQQREQEFLEKSKPIDIYKDITLPEESILGLWTKKVDNPERTKGFKKIANKVIAQGRPSKLTAVAALTTQSGGERRRENN